MSKAAVKVDADATGDDDRPGGVRNPFKQLHVPKKPAAPAADRRPRPRRPTSRPGRARAAPTAPSRRSPRAATAARATAAPSPRPRRAIRSTSTTCRCASAAPRPSQLKTYHDVARLSPLPTADNPFFVYTGVLKDGKTAVFLLSSDATATGDGHCRPSSKSCQTIEVKEGDTEFFDLTVDGEAVQYQLDVVKVFKKGASTAAAAAAAYERHSNAGADMLRKAHRVGSSAFKGASTYRWLPDGGVLVRTPKQSKARASVNGAAAASPADATGALPGLPVWAWQPAGA